MEMFGLGNEKSAGYMEALGRQYESEKKRENTSEDPALRKGNNNESGRSVDSSSSAMNSAINEPADELDQSVEYTPLTPEELDRMGNMQNVTYKTKDVAARLGITEQLVRNYCMYFEPFLNIEKLPSNQRRFKEEDINKLGAILQLMREKNMTVNETIQYLQSGDEKAQLYIAPVEEKLDIFLKLIGDVVKSTAATAYADMKDRLLEDSKTDNEALQKLNEKIEQQEESINALKEELQERDDMIRQLLDEKLSSIEKDSAQNRDAILEEMKKKKKFPFFR